MVDFLRSVLEELVGQHLIACTERATLERGTCMSSVLLPFLKQRVVGGDVLQQLAGRSSTC